MNRILVIGGAGYVGTVLVNELLKKNYKVTVYDLFIYGNNFTENPNLILEKGDVRDISKRVNINHLLSKVREEKNKERNENYLFLGVVLSVIAITGVLASL